MLGRKNAIMYSVLSASKTFEQEEHMNESILTDRIEDTPAAATPKAFQTIVFGGLSVGILDGLAATVNAGIRGITPDRVFQYISSGLLGKDSFEGGAATVILGILLHFVIAFGVATVFYLLSSNLPVLIRYALIAGPLYGVAVYFMMGYVIVPLSRVTQPSFTIRGLVTGIIIHMLFVGTPVALWARRSAKTKQ